MAIKRRDGTFQCVYCERIYRTEAEADKCREDHDIIYIPLSRSDLNKLLNYMMIPDPKVLAGSNVSRILFRYMRGNNFG